MKCAQHNDRDAVGTCPDCGRGLCSECTNKYTIPICSNCNAARFGTEKRSMSKMVTYTVIGAGIGLLFGYSITASLNAPFLGKLLFSLVYCYFGASIIWGWSALNKITPKVFLFMPLIGWFIYFILKFTISGMIGWVVMPIELIKLKSRTKVINTTLAQ